MKTLIFSGLPLLALACFVGCGSGSGTAEPTTNQSEVADWVKDNPAPPETPVD